MKITFFQTLCKSLQYLLDTHNHEQVRSVDGKSEVTLSFEVQRWNPEGHPNFSCSFSFLACSSLKHWRGLFSEHLLLWGKFFFCFVFFNSEGWTFLHLNRDFLPGVLDSSNSQKLPVTYLNTKYLVDELSKFFSTPGAHD